jgi:hypothetical protein
MSDPPDCLQTGVEPSDRKFIIVEVGSHAQLESQVEKTRSYRSKRYVYEKAQLTFSLFRVPRGFCRSCSFPIISIQVLNPELDFTHRHEAASILDLNPTYSRARVCQVPCRVHKTTTDLEMRR